MYVTGLVSVALVLTRVLDISRVGGRYPHGVPLVSGRSSRPAEAGPAVAQRAGLSLSSILSQPSSYRWSFLRELVHWFPE